MFLNVPGSNNGVVKLFFRAKTVPRQDWKKIVADSCSRAEDDCSAQHAVARNVRRADANANADAARLAWLAEQLALRNARRRERRTGN